MNFVLTAVLNSADSHHCHHLQIFPCFVHFPISSFRCFCMFIKRLKGTPDIDLYTKHIFSTNTISGGSRILERGCSR